MKKPLVASLTMVSSIVLLLMGYALWSSLSDKHNRLLLQAFAELELGDKRLAVSKKLATLMGTSALKRVADSNWEKYHAGVLDDWLLFVHYTNDIVNFVGILSTDRLDQRPKNAPPWKASDGFVPTF